MTMLHSLFARILRVGAGRSWLLLVMPCCMSAVAWGWNPAPRAMTHTPELPALAFDQYLVDLREISPTDEVRAHFLFSNRGQTPVKITKLEPSCGCLQPKLSKDVIRAGGVGSFMLRVKTALQKPGLKEFLVRVLYEDPQPREETVVLRVVFPEKQVYLRPMSLSFHQNGTSPVSQEIVLTDLRDKAVSLLGVKSTNEFFTAEVLEEGRDAEGAKFCKVRVTAAGDVPPGRHFGEIQIVTDDLQFHELSVPVQMFSAAPKQNSEQLASPEVYGPRIR